MWTVIQVGDKSKMRTIINRINQRVLQTSLKALFWLRYRQRHARLGLEKVNGLTLLVPPQVFNPALFGSSLFLANYLRQHPASSGSCTLDLGCGSGLLGLTLALTGAKVVATDINPEAVWVSGVNAHLNDCADCYEVRQGSLYQPVAGQQFDLIVMNPPYYAHTPTSLLEQAFMAGPGLETLRGMLVGAATHLKPDGRALAVVSSTIPMTEVLTQVAQAGLDWQIVARRRFWAEWHLIYEFRLTSHGL
jgi:methylase of polypeptide subunit release factors